MADGKVIFDYVGDTSGIDKANRDAEGKINSFGSKMASVTTKIAAAIGVAVIAAGAAFVAFAKKGIEIASDLQEVQNVIDVTFGESADVINAWSKTAAQAYGLSELEAKKYAGTMGAMLKSMGLTDSAALDMSESLSGLAGDLSSFYNLGHDEAWEKIRSGIAGETEPLKQLGINMSEANLQAFALAEGLGASYSAMSEAEKTTLRYNYLLSVTSDAQGDFARTSDSWANQLRTAQMNVDNLAKTLGETLMPALTPVIKAFNDEAFPKLNDALNALSENGVFDKLGASLGDLVGTLGEALAGFVGPLSELLAALGDTLAAILPPLVDILGSIIGPLSELAESILPILEGIFEALAPIFAELAETILPELAKIFDTLGPPIQKIIEEVLGFYQVLFEKLNPAINSLIDNILPPLADILEIIGILLGEILPIVELIFDVLGPLIELIGGGLAVVLGIVADALSIIVGLIGLIIEGVKWLLGAETDFETFTDLITKPFSENGSTYSVFAKAAAGGATQYDSYDDFKAAHASGASESAGAFSDVPDDQLTDEQWYSKYMGSNAKGTPSWRGGPTWVGELGPEIVNIPAGAQIYPADVSARMASSPSINNHNASSVIGEVKVYPDSVEYMRILRLLESSDRARQTSRAGG